jgi:hypothetical protein
LRSSFNEVSNWFLSWRYQNWDHQSIIFVTPWWERRVPEQQLSKDQSHVQWPSGEDANIWLWDLTHGVLETRHTSL